VKSNRNLLNWGKVKPKRKHAGAEVLVHPHLDGQKKRRDVGRSTDKLMNIWSGSPRDSVSVRESKRKVKRRLRSFGDKEAKRIGRRVQRTSKTFGAVFRGNNLNVEKRNFNPANANQLQRGDRKDRMPPRINAQKR